MPRKRRRQKNQPKAIFILPLVLLSALLLFFNFNIYRERQEINTHLQRVKEEYQDLSASLNEHQQEEQKEEITEERIERIAREQLLLKREGESVIIISHDEDPREEAIKEDEDDNKEEDVEEKSFFNKILSIFSRE